MSQKPKPEPEAKVKIEVKKALARLTHVYQFWPVQTGYGKRTLDCILCINGVFVAVETKRADKDLTELQKDIKRDMELANGIVFRVRDEEELTTFIEFCKSIGAESKH